MKTILVSLLFVTLVEAWTIKPLKVRSVPSSSTSLNMGLRTSVQRVRDSVLNKERSREDLKIGIAGFYDRSSKLWEDVWGEVRENGESFPNEDSRDNSSHLFNFIAHAPWVLHSRKPHRSSAGSD